MQTNEYIITFLKNNYLLLSIVVILLIRVIPSEWAGFWKYNNNKEEDGIAPRISLLRMFFQNIIDALWGTVIINIAVFLRDTIISFIIFGALGFDIFIRHTISRESITLVCIGVIVLYLENLIKTGKRLKLFGWLLQWEKEDVPESIPGQVSVTKTIEKIQK